MMTQTFDRIRTLVRERSAIVLEPGKEYLVETRLQPVAEAHGLGTVDALCRSLDRDRADLIPEVVDAMTTNETSFFRDHHPFEVLRNELLPDLLRRLEGQRRLRILCAACSTGQEPYSVAMTLRVHFPELSNWDVKITATDLSRTVLERARAGRYRQLEVNRGLPSSHLVRFFTRRGMEWEIDPSLRALVTFREMNLVDEWTNVETQDVIFLRNVLIYFDPTIKRQILGMARQHLVEGGYLLLGGAETVPSDDTSFERVPTPRSGAYRATIRR